MLTKKPGRVERMSLLVAALLLAFSAVCARWTGKTNALANDEQEKDWYKP
jgi:hypothetical protein